MRYSFLVTCILLCLSCAEKPVATIPVNTSIVRVRILSRSNVNSFSLSINKGFLFHDNGELFLEKGTVKFAKKDGMLSVELPNQSLISGSILCESTGGFTVGMAGLRRRYKGNLHVIGGEELLLVNTVRVEDYIADAVISEAGELLALPELSDSAREELRKAMEVVIRSYVLAAGDRHESPHYELCDLTHCIHYQGNLESGGNLTRGEVLLDHQGEILQAFFHSDSGGVLSSPAVMWPGFEIKKGFRSGKDRFFSKGLHSPHENWQFETTIDEMVQLFSLPSVDGLVLEKEEGRVRNVNFLTNEKTLPVSIAEFMTVMGHRFGWNSIKSNNFDCILNGNSILFEGKGLGHGVGMSQWGAASMAVQGASYRKILEYYYEDSGYAHVKYPDDGFGWNSR